jgi:magnesium chelatase family protein
VEQNRDEWRTAKYFSIFIFMLVKTFGSAVYGVDAITITLEVNVMAGSNYYIVGLPDSAVKESLQRVESALKTNG